MGPLPPRSSLFPVPPASTETRNTLLGAASSVSDRWPQYTLRKRIGLARRDSKRRSASLFGSASAGVGNCWMYAPDLTRCCRTSRSHQHSTRMGRLNSPGSGPVSTDIIGGTPSEAANSLLIGSWGKRTQVRPPRDVDILFLLPSDVYHRFQQREGKSAVAATARSQRRACRHFFANHDARRRPSYCHTVQYHTNRIVPRLPLR